MTALDRHGGRGRALVARRHIDVVALREQIGVLDRAHAAAIDRQRLQPRIAVLEDIAGIRIAGVFKADRGPLAREQIRDQIERLLAADRHDDFVRHRKHAAPRQHARADLLDQRIVVALDQIRRPVADLHDRQRFHAAFAPVVGRKQRLVELSVDKGIFVAQPVARLDDIALRGRPSSDALVPIRPRERLIGRLSRGPSAAAQNSCRPSRMAGLTKCPLRSREIR